MKPVILDLDVGRAVRLWLAGVIGVSCFLAGGFIGWIVRNPPPPIHRDIVVTPDALRAVLPDVDAGWLERWWRVSLERDQRAVAPGGAEKELAAFCKPAVEEARAAADTTRPRRVTSEPVPVPTPDLRTLIYAYRIDEPFPSFFRRSRIEHFGVRNDGALTQETYRGAGDLEGRATGDSMPAEGSRWWWVKDLVELGVCVELGRVSTGSFP